MMAAEEPERTPRLRLVWRRVPFEPPSSLQNLGVG